MDNKLDDIGLDNILVFICFLSDYARSLEDALNSVEPKVCMK